MASGDKSGWKSSGSVVLTVDTGWRLEEEGLSPPQYREGPHSPHHSSYLVQSTHSNCSVKVMTVSGARVSGGKTSAAAALLSHSASCKLIKAVFANTA